MTYEKLMELVLAGRSVNAAAKAMGLTQRQLDYYVKAQNLPDCDAAIVLAEAAGTSIEETVRAIAAKKAELRPERARSFLRPAMASVLAGIVAVNLFLTPSPAQAAPAKALSEISQATTLYYVKLHLAGERQFEIAFVCSINCRRVGMPQSPAVQLGWFSFRLDNEY